MVYKAQRGGVNLYLNNIILTVLRLHEIIQNFAAMVFCNKKLLIVPIDKIYA